jgi:hypothetical protein
VIDVEERNRLLAKAPWGELRKELAKYAKNRMGTRNLGKSPEDIAGDAIVIVLDPDKCTWDYVAEPELSRHLQSVANGLMGNAGRHEAVVSKHVDARDETAMDRAPDDADSPEKLAHLRELLEKFGAHVGRHLGPRGLAYIAKAAEPREDLEKELNLSEQQVKDLRKAAIRYLDVVKRDMGLADVPNMYIPRVVKSSEAEQLRKELEAFLPPEIRGAHERSGLRKRLVVLAIVSLVVGSCVGYNECGPGKHVERQTPIPTSK